jgi:hypothetical protein
MSRFCLALRNGAFSMAAIPGSMIPGQTI